MRQKHVPQKHFTFSQSEAKAVGASTTKTTAAQQQKQTMVMSLLRITRQGQQPLLFRTASRQLQQRFQSSSSSLLLRRQSLVWHRQPQRCYQPQQQYLPVLSCVFTIVGYTTTAFCQSHAISDYHPAATTTTTTITTHQRRVQEQQQHQLAALQRHHYWRQWLQRGWRLVWRLCKLTAALTPVVVLYPLFWYFHVAPSNKCEVGDAHAIVLQSLGKDDNNTPSNAATNKKAHAVVDWYLRVCLHCVEASGAAVIKLMQWAGSRPDLFGHDFCAVFSQLQDSTTPHSFKHTKRVMAEAYGDDWREKIQLAEILGSGCIGQVYKGYVVGNEHGNNGSGGGMKEVAVKVLHPSVEEDIDADLDLMRLAVRVIEATGMFPALKWLNLNGLVEEFADLLKLQLDLREEAINLERFNQNFKDDPMIVFPKLISEFPCTKSVLVETFVEGVPVLKFARDNQEDQQMLHDMCVSAIRAVCKMIFLDNFMHGDLHPGNVFVSGDGKKFILFDVGIAAEYSETDHRNIVEILGAFIRKQGRKAGRLMIDDSNNRLRALRTGDAALDEETYIDKIEKLTIDASRSGYVMEQLGTYITYICNAASDHHIMLNPSFVSAALAVKVQEGIALALDPSIPIWKVATPIIIESESRRKGLEVSKTMGIDGFLASIFGNNDNRK